MDLSPENKLFVKALCRKLGVRCFERTNKLKVIFKPGHEEDRMDVLRTHHELPVKTPDELEQPLTEQQEMDIEFLQWKRDYYKNKLEIEWEDVAGRRDVAVHYLQAIQWVLLYYYDGVASWSWYYPYHYAPLINDLTGVQSLNFTFELAKPFKPFEQLMGVLPPASRSLVPVCYHDLMTSDQSPIKSFYPETFPEDLNGKKAKWEAVVKIPFIDEKRLLDAMEPENASLTPEEEQRNASGKPQFFYHVGDGDFTFYYTSSVPGTFPDLESCRCQMEEHELRLVETHELKRGLLPGVQMGSASSVGFPSLNHLQFDHKIEKCQVSVFQQDSKDETIALYMHDQFAGSAAEDVAKELLNTVVFVGWPFLLPALVAEVSDASAAYCRAPDTKQVEKKEHTKFWAQQWDSKIKELMFTQRRHAAVMVEDAKLLFKVRLFKGMKKLQDGAVVREFVDELEPVLPALVVLRLPYDDPRFMENSAIPIEQDLPLNVQVYYLGGRYYGYPAEVVKHHTCGQMTVCLSAMIDPRHVDNRVVDPRDKRLGHTIIERHESRINYTPSYIVEKTVGMSRGVLSRITSSMLLKDRNERRCELGLAMKFSKREEKVPGMTRKLGRTWEYSQEAVGLIQEYKERAPEFIQQLETFQRQHRDPDRLDEYCDTDDVMDKCMELAKWLKEVKAALRFATIPISMQLLDKETVLDVEKEGDAFQHWVDKGHWQKRYVSNVPRGVCCFVFCDCV
jgi:5'-3' exoribonuclease 1